jgi:3-oxoacyl-[acyl-carrier-protein] synthase-3
VSCVPKQVQKVEDCECLTKEEAAKLIETTGISERRIASKEICTSDLCIAAANHLIDSLGWSRAEIDALIFVTQTPDYILPATSPILQSRLGLGQHCFTMDISLGCSGYVYGLITLANLMTTGTIKKGLLLVGDTVTKICSPLDKSTFPLFGDAGTASAFSYDKLATPIIGNLRSDGSGFKSIIINDGAFRAPITADSLVVKQISTGISRSNGQLVLEGMDVFSFGITKAPEVIRQLFKEFDLADENVDYYIFHQANMMMNEKIRKKLALAEAKVPYTLSNYGNTSSATIPLTISVKLKHLIGEKSRLLLCGFGVGLSWGAVYLESDPLLIVDYIEI